MYKVGSVFLYGENGICRIEQIITKTIKSEEKEYYVLKPLYHSGSTIFVPVDNLSLVERLHNILSKDELLNLCSYASSEKSNWIVDDNERNFACCNALISCNRKDLIKLLISVHDHKLKLKEVGKHLRTTDDSFMKKAEKILSEEISLIMQIPIEDSLSFLFNQ